MPFDHFRETLLQGANDAASQIALQSPVTEDEFERLVNILRGFGIDAYTAIAMTDAAEAAKFAQRRWFGFR